MEGSLTPRKSLLNDHERNPTNLELDSIPSHQDFRRTNHPERRTSPINDSRIHCLPLPFNEIVLPAGESGRKGFHPLLFLRICWRSASRASRICNVFWPVVPAAIVVRYTRPDLHTLIFILNYAAMIPCANMIGFTGRELSRKINKVLGLLIEATIGSVVEIVMFMVLIRHNEFDVIKAAILGSILTTQLLCLGMCFFVGGLRHNELEFSSMIGEVGSGLLLTAGFALIIPSAFHSAVIATGRETLDQTNNKVLRVSRITAGLLMLAFFIYTFFQIQTHETMYSEIYEQDESKSNIRAKESDQPKFTMTECIIGIFISVILVTFIAIVLVEKIPYILHIHQWTEGFVGLILVPFVEKFAEHLTAIDESWDNKMNIALSKVLGSTIQTSLFNAPLVVLVGFALNKPMDLNFDLLLTIFLILAILVVGNFLRDQKSNYLEGSLTVIVYLNIAATIYYFPDDGRTMEDGI